MQKESSVLQAASKDQYFQLGHGTGNSFKKTSALDNGVDGTTPSYKGFSVNKSIEFSYEELAKATNDLNIVNKIGQGGFGSVYYAELRGEFEDFFSKPNSIEDLCKLVDPTIVNDHSLDAVHMMAQLGRACTDEKPQLRPSMRSVVVALMTLSSTEVWDTGMLYENQHTSSDPSVDY